ncbi:MAG: hypothetical protein BGO07_04865 [Alphaproteobacteria bacterium 40-19]|nr:MAG: hypothetical protein BGO07_04865 [Alphaproteobacteria bacterium 40-19]
MNKKDLETIAKYLHDAVHMRGPFLEKKDKTTVLELTPSFFPYYDHFEIKSMTDLQDRVLVEYEIHSPAPTPVFKAISVIRFQDNLISSIDIFSEGSWNQNDPGAH